MSFPTICACCGKAFYPYGFVWVCETCEAQLRSKRFNITYSDSTTPIRDIKDKFDQDNQDE